MDPFPCLLGAGTKGRFSKDKVEKIRFSLVSGLLPLMFMTKVSEGCEEDDGRSKQ